MDMELDLELTPYNELRWDIDGTGTIDRDRVGPKLRSKSHNPNMDLDPGLTPIMILSET